MLLFQYVYYPISFDLRYANELREYLNDSQLEFAQFLFLGGVTIFLLGLVIGAGRRPRHAPLFGLPIVSEASCVSARRVASVLSIISLGSFLYGSLSSGALTGADTEFGYLNEAYHFSVPATAFYLVSRSGRRLGLRDLAICIFLLSPLLMRGIFVAKRGPLLMFFIALGIGWHLAQGRRPNLTQLAGAGLAVIVLVLFVFFNRGAIWSGSSIDTSVSISDIASINAGNDYIYGAAMANFAQVSGNHGWGANYFITFFVRPIPSQIWPTKYDDARLFFNLDFYGAIATRFEYLEYAASQVLGWRIAPGAAWGLVTDVYFEFRYFGYIAVYILGYIIGRIWRNAGRTPLWFVVYMNIMSSAPYIVAQDLMDSGFRILFMSVPSLVLFFILRRKEKRMLRSITGGPPNQRGLGPVGPL